MNIKCDGKSFELIEGDITKLDVDVIVNAAHTSLLGGGGVDGAIHRAAGPSLLQECKSIEQVEPGVRCRVGEAFMTSGGRLLTKYVIHTVAPKFVGSIIGREKVESASPRLDNFVLTRNIYKNINPSSDENLAECYKNCIKLADSYGLRVIAFPSLGTGGHAYPVEVAAPIAIKTSIKYALQAKSVEKVIFVTFSKEDYGEYVNIMRELSK